MSANQAEGAEAPSFRPVTTAAYRNPHASGPFSLRFIVVRNTSDEEIAENIKVNAARDLDWLDLWMAHDGIAVIVGGGPSVIDCVHDIRGLIGAGATVFAGNAASQFLFGQGIKADYQVIGDAKPETAQLVDERAGAYLIASQANPATVDRAAECGYVTLWHLMNENVEDLFPPRRVKRGGYSLIVGSSTVGDFMVRIAYQMGFRELHIFGFDSCHRDGRSHAYAQPMNDTMPGTAIEWGGRTFYASLAMKAQAEKFQTTARILKQKGCKIEVYGDGLLQAMYRADPKELSERDVYRLMWQHPDYRRLTPGEFLVPTFLEVAHPEPGAQVIDFGCGTGRASLALQAAGLNPLLVDFADNCRDAEAVMLPFLEADLTQPNPLRAPYGFCTDVMEHIPTKDVAAVIDNIMASAGQVMFQIATFADGFGALIGRPLHLTVRPHYWWRDLFAALGHSVLWQRETPSAAVFYIQRKEV